MVKKSFKPLKMVLILVENFSTKFFENVISVSSVATELLEQSAKLKGEFMVFEGALISQKYL